MHTHFQLRPYSVCPLGKYSVMVLTLKSPEVTNDFQTTKKDATSLTPYLTHSGTKAVMERFSFQQGISTRAGWWLLLLFIYILSLLGPWLYAVTLQ